MVIKNDSFSSQEMQWEGPLADYLSMFCGKHIAPHTIEDAAMWAVLNWSGENQIDIAEGRKDDFRRDFRELHRSSDPSVSRQKPATSQFRALTSCSGPWCPAYSASGPGKTREVNKTTLKQLPLIRFKTRRKSCGKAELMAAP